MPIFSCDLAMPMQQKRGGAGTSKAEAKKPKKEEEGISEGVDDKGSVQLVGEACNFHKPGEGVSGMATYKHSYYIYIFIAALIFLLEYFRITRAFCILPYCTVYIVRSL